GGARSRTRPQPLPGSARELRPPARSVSRRTPATAWHPGHTPGGTRRCGAHSARTEALPTCRFFDRLAESRSFSSYAVPWCAGCDSSGATTSVPTDGRAPVGGHAVSPNRPRNPGAPFRLESYPGIRQQRTRTDPPCYSTARTRRTDPARRLALDEHACPSTTPSPVNWTQH